jgi:predicted MFS family arabinose efflux permease
VDRTSTTGEAARRACPVVGDPSAQRLIASATIPGQRLFAPRLSGRPRDRERVDAMARPPTDRIDASTPRVSDLTARAALTFVVLLGVVSLFADVTYEGARSITGPYLGILGAGAAAVGIVAGLGELIGYGLRLVSGYLSDRTQRYWTVTIIGYGLNLAAVPLLALAGRWEIAALLIIAERTGKAIRTPARDAMLAHGTARMGRGWGFGLHEALDQTGALIGPLLVALVLAVDGGYERAFAVLAVPALLALVVLVLARLRYPNPSALEVPTARLEPEGLPRVFWIYLAAAGLVAAGFIDFPLAAFHFQEQAVIRTDLIPIFYAAAMGADAVSALLFGRLYDRIGLATLVIVTLLSALFAPLVFLGGSALALLGVIIWGVGLGAHESVMRAAVAPMVAVRRRGTAYGIFNTGYGLFWFVGSAAMGILYGVSIPWMIALSVALELAAIPIFLWAIRTERAAV